MNRLYWIAAMALVVLAWGASAWLYPGLPTTIPTHWNIRGQIDGHGPKGTVFLMPSVMLGLLVLFRFLPALSPRNFEVDSLVVSYGY